jgi:hypothetical protein
MVCADVARGEVAHPGLQSRSKCIGSTRKVCPPGTCAPGKDVSLVGSRRRLLYSSPWRSTMLVLPPQDELKRAPRRDASGGGGSS